MHYEGDIIRPPSEAGSIILQVTVGCSHNRCTFCGAYRGKRFRIKDEDIIRQDLEFAAAYCRRQKTLFLADGNAMAIPQQQLVRLLQLIREYLPHVRRVGLYANARDILGRSPQDLERLMELGLRRVYMGLETGHNPTLEKICKGADAAAMVQAGRMIRQAGLFLSVMVLLGIAGPENSQDHALATAAVLNEMKPSQVAVLTLMVLANTPLASSRQAGRFVLPDIATLFLELRTMLAHLDLERTLFHCNHASNYFELDGRLSKDKMKMIELIDKAVAGSVDLKPEHRRAL